MGKGGGGGRRSQVPTRSLVSACSDLLTFETWRSGRVQVAAARAIPVLPKHTAPGDVILSSRASSGLTAPVQWDPEMEKLSLAHLGAACREALPAVVGPGAAQGSGQHALEEEHRISPEGSHGSADSSVEATVGGQLLTVHIISNMLHSQTRKYNNNGISWACLQYMATSQVCPQECS